jgi:hypothetical protein
MEKAFEVFDAGIEFQPLTRQFSQLTKRRYIELLGKLFYCLPSKILTRKQFDEILDYRAVVENDLKYDFQQNLPIFPGVCPGWDNSSRRPLSSALILDKSTPELFNRWVCGKVTKTNWNLLPEKFLFVNAWNEWAEGNHLEPCERWGTQYLAEMQNGLNEVQET